MVRARDWSKRRSDFNATAPNVCIHARKIIFFLLSMQYIALEAIKSAHR